MFWRILIVAAIIAVATYDFQMFKESGLALRDIGRIIAIMSR